MDDSTTVNIRRQWDDHRTAQTAFGNLSNLHWDTISGGINAKAPQPFIHAYVDCPAIEGNIAHSCQHGTRPHPIKVCIVKKENSEIFEELVEVVGPKPDA